MAETFSEVILRYKVDKTSLTQAVAANNQIRAQISGVGTQATQTSSQLRAAFQPRTSELFKTSMAGARISIANARKEASALGQELADAAREADKTAAATNRINVNSPAPRGAADVLDQRDTAASRVSSILGALPGGSEFANIAGLVADINAAGKSALDAGTNLQTLALAGGASAVAIAGIALALQNFINVTQESRANLTAAISAQAAYYDAVATLDEEGAAARIAELQASLDTQRRLAAEARNAADSAFEQLAVEGTEIVARAAFALDPALQALAASASEAEAGLASTEQEITRLTQGLEAGEFAANNAAVAQTELAAATQLANAAVLASINERVNKEVEYARLAASASTESIQAQIDANNIRVQALNDELAALELMAEHGADTTAAVSDLNHQITELERDTQRLSGTVLESARAREQEAASARDSADAARERAQTLSQVANLERQLRDQTANERRADARAERDFNRQRLREDLDFQAQLAQQEQEFNQSQLDAIKEAQEADIEARDNRLETEKDYSQREIERVKSFNERIADINRRASDEVGDAAGELDAKRVDAALRAKQQELADAVKENDKQAQENAQARDERLQQIEEERKERQSELAQRLADERQNFQEARAQQIADFNLRRQRENEDRAIRRNDELQDRNLRRQGLQQQIADLKNSIDQEKQIRRQGYAAMLADARNAFGQLGGSGKGNIGAGSSNGFGSPPPSSGGGSGGGLGTGNKSPVGGGTSTGFNGGGGTSGFNGGFSNPSVMSTNNNQSNQVTFNISNPDPNAVAQTVRQTMAQVLSKK